MTDDPPRLLDTLVTATLACHAARAVLAEPAGSLEPYTVLHAAGLSLLDFGHCGVRG